LIVRSIKIQVKKENPKCKGCGTELIQYPELQDLIFDYIFYFKIPFTNIKIIIKNDKLEYVENCWQCEKDRQKDYYLGGI